MESYEQERLQKLIDYKRKQLEKITSKYYYQIMQAEITLLEKHIMPIIVKETNVKYEAISKYTINAVSYGEKLNLNGIMFFIPIKESYTDKPKIGIVNPKELLPYREIGALQVYINELEIINNDGNSVSLSPLNIPIDKIL
jgi:hypothetical protein